ncbi:alpha/beta fold hydrolase [Salinisphaera aquimarina]|uniref:Alpha/beta fold hydrolase n=1 Tax=Salinisphaera aquimarina TaxID=2094031 RepID=A0ABV7ETR7_9GAMM
MKSTPAIRALGFFFALLALSAPAFCADYPTPVQHDFVIQNFTFHDGEQLEQLKIHYATVGSPDGEPVLMLHGTTGSGNGMLRDGFAGALFGPGQALDASRYYIILPDAIGAGDSSKPSDGLRAEFPDYNYDDMVKAQYLLIKDGLNMDHLRLVMGYSMGGMQTWLWGIYHPDYMDALVPMASLPGPMSGRNWMLRRMMVDAVRTDPAWDHGNYTEQPPNLRTMAVWFSLASTGGTQRLHRLGPTGEKADAYVDEKLADAKVGDANDTLYQWKSSKDFDPSAELGRIKAPLLAINSADDERNPEELGVMQAGLEQIPQGQFYQVPGSPQTTGHGTVFLSAALYEPRLAAFMAQLPQHEGQ